MSGLSDAGDDVVFVGALAPEPKTIVVAEGAGLLPKIWGQCLVVFEVLIAAVASMRHADHTETNPNKFQQTDNRENKLHELPMLHNSSTQHECPPNYEEIQEFHIEHTLPTFIITRK